MAQRLFDDKIGTLIHNAGTITMAASRLTIGGQQYVTGSLNVAVDAGLANTRYQIFAVVNAGVVSLVVTQNENSQGPAGANAWKLVGSYYTNGLTTIGFGSFVTITGVPTTRNAIEHIPIFSSAGGVLGAGTGGNAAQFSLWSRTGNVMDYSFSLRFGTSGASGGSGVYEGLLPGVLNWQPYPDEITSGGASLVHFGHGSLFDNSSSNNYSTFIGNSFAGPTDEFRMYVNNQIVNSNPTVGAAFPFGASAGDIYRGQLTVSIQEWDNTPIEDL